MFRSIHRAVRARLALPALAALAAWASPSWLAAQALSSDAATIVQAVKQRNPSLPSLCANDGAGIRPAIMDAIMPLMQQRRLSGNPVETGAEAGAAIRRECVALSAPGSVSGPSGATASSAVTAVPADPMAVMFEGRSRLAPIRFHLEASTMGLLTRPHNQLLRPAEGVPRPAAGWPTVVYVPGCGDLLRSHVAQVSELLQAGYAVLAVDAYGPRSQRDCRNGVVNPGVVAGDALQALEQLQAVDGVDKRRIYLVGQSIGGMAAQWASGEANLAKAQAASASKPRFAALVSRYSSCRLPITRGADMPVMPRDVATPLLMLMGQDDLETPPATCFPLLEELKAQGRPVSWHVYPSPATHGWDLQEANGLVHITPSGQPQVYRYDRAVADDAMRRTLEFLRTAPPSR